jgi:hypothetical protein
VKCIFRAICFLSRQGLALRGHNESETSVNGGNLVELMEEMSIGNEKLKPSYSANMVTIAVISTKMTQLH